MGEKITRREFIKKWSILGLGTIFAASKLGSMPKVHAQVSDNTDSTDITNDTIHIDAAEDTDVFHDGESAKDLANAVNGLSKSFSNALAKLKDTAIAKAIGVSGSTFTEVNEELATIVDRGSVSKALDCGEAYVIEKGYHDGTGQIVANSLASQTTVDEGAEATSASILEGFQAWIKGKKLTGTMKNNGSHSAKIGSGNTTGAEVSVPIPAGYHDGNGKVYVSGKKNITANGDYDVASFSSVNVNVSLSNSTFSIAKADTEGYVSINCNVGDILFAAGFIGNKPSYSGAIQLAYSAGSNVNAMGMFILKATSTTVAVGFSYTGHIMRLY